MENALQRRLAGSSIAVLLFCAVVAVNPVFSQTKEIDVYLRYSDFTWKEFDGKSRLLTETGALFGPGLSYYRETPEHLTIKPRVELLFGDVDYDGHIQSGEAARTTVSYRGIRLQGDLGRRFGESSFIEPFLGLDYRAWSRRIQDGRTESGLTAAGYTENWTSIYARLGLRGGSTLSENARVFAEGGVKLPYYNQNEVSLGFSLHPGKQAALFAELGIQGVRLKGSLFYDGLRYSQSEAINLTDGVNIFSVVQPESRADIVGFTLGATF